MKNSYLVLLLSGILSCGGSEETTVRSDFRVEIYSLGGFSGSAEGVIVTGDGWARFWRGRTAALRSTVDSLRVDRKKLIRIQALADSDDGSSFRYDKRGNLTTVLTIQRKTGFYQFSFPGEKIPSSFPAPLQELIAELRKLR